MRNCHFNGSSTWFTFMNILFHCWEYPPRGSGIGQYVYFMSKALRELGCYIVVVTSYGTEGASEEIVANGKIYRIYEVEDIGKEYISEEILKIAIKHNIDWIEGVDHLGESSGLIRKVNRPPIVIKAHYNDVFKTARYAHVYYFWQKYMIKLACVRDHSRISRERFSLANADVLIAPSKRIIEEMETQELCLSDRRYTVPNPIYPLQTWHNVESKSPTLLFVGRIDIGKGIEYLERLISCLVKRYPNLIVEIAGGDGYARFIGSTKAWLTRQMGDRSCHINFLGKLNKVDLDRAYARAWVVILPSKWDTFPTVVLEAMERAKAIVASDNGGMPEMLAGTKCRVADPRKNEFYQAVADFLEDKSVRDSAGKSAQEKVRITYSPGSVARDYLRILKKELGKKL